MRQDNSKRTTDTTMLWIRRGSLLAVLVIGWLFILFQNHFHITPPTVFACIAFFAVVCAVYTLFRTGATAVTANDEDDDEASWGKPLGHLGELELEKRALLKAIKEAEFDQMMGKLSKADAERMIAVYRARAIEVIKEIDVQNTATGKAGTVRDRILREARARIELEAKSAKDAAKVEDKKVRDKSKGGDKQKQRADKLAAAVTATAAAAKVDVDRESEKVAVIVDTSNNAIVDVVRSSDATDDDEADEAAAKAEDAKAAAQPDVNPSDAKDDRAAEAAAKSDAKRSDAKSDATLSDAKADAKVDVKPSDAKSEAKPSDAKVDAKSDAKPSDAKADAKSDAPAAGDVPASKEAAR